MTETRMAICLAGFLSFRGRRACNAPAAWIECVARRRRAVERGVRRVTASHDLLRFLPCVPPMHPGCLPVGGGSHASSMMPGGAPMSFVKHYRRLWVGKWCRRAAW
ncbi:hypothetical protein, partial [Burkholderia pseudomallei]